MKIGIVALHWPPNYGGAERYNSRLVDELNNKGVEAWGITPTAADENMDNGLDKLILVLIGFTFKMKGSNG